MSRNGSRWQGRAVVIVEAARTPIGRGHAENGAFRDVQPNALLGAAYQAVIERAGIDAAIVEDVVAGAVSQVGEQSNNIARNAWLQAGPSGHYPAATALIGGCATGTSAGRRATGKRNQRSGAWRR